MSDVDEQMLTVIAMHEELELVIWGVATNAIPAV